jgi:Ca2+-binding EF-hand superfamily protein
MPSPRRLGKGRVQFIGEQGWRDSRRTMTKFLPLAAILALLASPTLAAPPKAPAAKAAPREATRADMAKRFDARFAQIDTNKDGSLSRAEVDAARASFVGLTGKVITDQVKQEFALTDKNKDGQASLAEMTAAAPAEGKAGVAKVLEKLDANNDQQLSQAEFAAAAPPPKVAGSDDFLARFDADKDVKVTAAEYKAPGLAAFDQIDANKDGKVTAAEQQAARSATQGR